MNVIETEKLNVWYSENHALKDLTMGIERNQVVAIMGPSGCGKSTLIRTFNRMNDMISDFHLSGRVLFDGLDIYNEKQIGVHELRKRIGMVFQKPNPFPTSIFDNIAYGPSIHGIKDEDELKKIVQDSLEKAAIWSEVKDRLKENAMSLSGGQQQRLCIARALAVNPEVLLMDEPVAHLDPVSAAKIERLIVDLAREYTIIVVTHNVQQAIRISQKAFFLYLGELVEYGDTSRILENPKDERTEAFLTGRLG